MCNSEYGYRFAKFANLLLALLDSIGSIVTVTSFSNYTTLLDSIGGIVTEIQRESCR